MPCATQHKRTRGSRTLSAPTVPTPVPIACIPFPVAPRGKKKKKPSGKPIGKPRTTNKYWVEDEITRAIIEYNASDMDRRNRIYETTLARPFFKLIENIYNTFKFSYLEDSPTRVMEQALAHTVSAIGKFNPKAMSKRNPGQKARSFSYFSLVAKNYLIAYNNTNYRRFNTFQSLDHLSVPQTEYDNIDHYDYDVPQEVQVQAEQWKYNHKELFRIINEFWDKNLTTVFRNPKDRLIAEGVCTILRKANSIELCHKKYLYLCIREMADAKGQQVTKIIRRMWTHIKRIIDEYNNSGEIYEREAA